MRGGVFLVLAMLTPVEGLVAENPGRFIQHRMEITPPKVAVGEVLEVRVYVKNIGKESMKGVSVGVNPSAPDREMFKGKSFMTMNSRPQNVGRGKEIMESFQFWATKPGYGKFDVLIYTNVDWSKPSQMSPLVYDETQAVLVVDSSATEVGESQLVTGNVGVAVFEFDALMDGEDSPALISDMFREELGKSGMKVVERERIDTLIGEMALQKTGCTETECAIRLGRLVSARFIVMGGVGTILGRKYALVRVIDVESGVVIGSGKADWSSKDEMVKSIRSTSRSISSIIGSK